MDNAKVIEKNEFIRIICQMKATASCLPKFKRLSMIIIYYLSGGIDIPNRLIRTDEVVSAVFLGIGIRCRKSSEEVGFFTFIKPPKVENIKQYNYAVSILWFVTAGIFEIIGIPILFLKQNSPLFIPIIFSVIFLVIAMMIVYLKIEAKYKR